MQELKKLDINAKEKNKPLSKQVGTVAGKIVSKQGYVSAIDLFLAIGWLNQKNLTDWKTGKIPYLEVVITANLKKISSVMKEFIAWADHSKLKASTTDYKHKNVKLIFSRSGNFRIEAAYRTHYVLLNPKAKEDAQETASF